MTDCSCARGGNPMFCEHNQEPPRPAPAKEHVLFTYFCSEGRVLAESYRLTSRWENIAGHCAQVAPKGTTQVLVTRWAAKQEVFRGSVAELAAKGGVAPPAELAPGFHLWEVAVKGLDGATLHTEVVQAVDRWAAEGFATGILRRYRERPDAATVKEVATTFVQGAA